MEFQHINDVSNLDEAFLKAKELFEMGWIHEVAIVSTKDFIGGRYAGTPLEGEETFEQLLQQATMRHSETKSFQLFRKDVCLLVIVCSALSLI